MLQCVAVCCSALQCVAMCCSVLQCVAVLIRYTCRTCSDIDKRGGGDTVTEPGLTPSFAPISVACLSEGSIALALSQHDVV